jgi:hypothetical protein
LKKSEFHAKNWPASNEAAWWLFEIFVSQSRQGHKEEAFSLTALLF